jgi:nucleotide-binding universal stress UspA family protein
MKMKKIIFATDYSEVNKKALDFAVSMARGAGALLLIVHVSEREQYPVGELFDEEAQPHSAEMTELKAVVPSDPEVRCEHRLIYGEPGSADITKPAVEIVKFADKEQVDAIVIGTHGRTGLSRVLMGSVAESVVRKAPCPVVTVKLAAESEE